MSIAPYTEIIMDCWVTGATGVDTELFDWWVHGVSDVDAAKRREPALEFPAGLNPTRKVVTSLLNRAECQEQYQIFEWLTPYLHNPPVLTSQSVFQLESEQARELIHLYYSLDDSVVRNLLGKMLSKALRRDIDEIAAATNTKLTSARRQFDNLKRVLKHVEQNVAKSRAEGHTIRRPILNIIMEDFLLPVELASHYLHAIFLCTNRMETFKGRLATLDLNEWNSIAGVVMAMWGEERAIELDPTFIEQMKEAKELLQQRVHLDQYRKLVVQHVRSAMPDQELGSLDACFNSVVKQVMQIGAGLQEQREVRDLFVDVLDKVLEPLHKADLTFEQVMIFFSIVDKVLPDLHVVKNGGGGGGGGALLHRSIAGQVPRPGSSFNLVPTKAVRLPPWAEAWRRCLEGIKVSRPPGRAWLAASERV